MQIEIIENIERWSAIRNEWNKLIDSCAIPNVFLTWEWLYAWARSFLNNERQLFIIAIYEKNELVAATPWCIRTLKRHFLCLRQIENMGSPETGSDYLDVPIKRGKEKQIVHLLYQYLLKEESGRWDRIWLNDVPSDSLFMNFMLERIQESGKYVGVNPASYCPVMELPNNEEDFYTSISPKRRRRFKQDLRYFQKMGTFEHKTFTSNSLQPALKQFFKLYSEKTNWSGEFLEKHLNHMILDSDGREMIQIDLLKIEDAYIGGLLHLKYKNTLYLYMMAIDKTVNPKISLGNLFVGFCIMNAIKSGIKYYDFLKGSEEYKFHWANMGHRSNNIVFCQRRSYALYLTMKEMVRSGVKLILR